MNARHARRAAQRREALAVPAPAPGALTPRPAVAQFGGKGMKTPLMMILLSDDVQKELKLSDAQKDRVTSRIRLELSGDVIRLRLKEHLTA